MSAPRRIALFGGTFDPIHRGHLDPALRVADQLKLDEVIYLPTARPPHKPGARYAPAWARYAMVELAVLDQARCRVDDYELQGQGAAYTIHSLEHFRRLYPDDELYLLLGADSFLSLPRWYRWRQYSRLVRLAVMVRPGYRLESATDHPELLDMLHRGRVEWVENEPLPISSSSIRDRFAQGQEIPRDWLPGLVETYIRKYDLYGGKTAPTEGL
ncbi:MAG: nicotinate-nucleotide adenylyltransferase [Acidobacteriota bacterium]